MKNNPFIPYNLALLAKEKGFNFDEIITFGWYFKYRFSDNISALDVGHVEYNQNFQQWEPKDLGIAPLYSQLTDWFLEKHKIYVTTTYNWHKGFGGLIDKQDFGKLTPYHKNEYEAWNEVLTEAFKLI